jgi:Zn-dependent protease
VNQVLFAVLNLLLIIPAIILHEVSHGYVAYLLGDPTAKNAGRLTLNPIAHVDLFGTIILPAVMFLTAGFAIGYAKPVPINPHLMTRSGYRNGMLLTGAAGPATNIVLALVAAAVFRLLALLSLPGSSIVMYMVAFFTLINLVLAFFNLIPIPPLDGSRVVQRFLSGSALEAYASLERYGILIVLAIAFILPRLVPGLDLLGGYLNLTVYPIARFLLGPLAGI